MSFSEPCAFRISAIAGQPIRTRRPLSWPGRAGQRRDGRGYAGRAGRRRGGPARSGPPPVVTATGPPPVVTATGPPRVVTTTWPPIRQPTTRLLQASLRRVREPFRDVNPLVSETPLAPSDSPASNSPVIS